MIEYLLDTNIVSDVLRRPSGLAAGRFRERRGRCAISIFVAAELRYGLRKRPGHVVEGRVDSLLETLPILSFEAPGDTIYADVRARLERSGIAIGMNDFWIAAHAASLNLVLVTANEREFRRVPGLRVENWIA